MAETRSKEASVCAGVEGVGGNKTLQGFLAVVEGLGFLVNAKSSL